MTMIIDGTNGGFFPSWTTATRPASPVVGQMGYNTTTGQFDAYTSTGWVSLINTGSSGTVLQVVSANRAGEVSTTSTSFVDASLSVSITPKFSTSKIFVLYTGSAGNDGSQESYLTIARNSTNLGNGSQGLMRIWYNGSSSYHFGGYSMSFLDSPATTSATTYKVQYRTNSGIVYISSGGSTDTITVMEIAG